MRTDKGVTRIATYASEYAAPETRSVSAIRDVLLKSALRSPQVHLRDPPLAALGKTDLFRTHEVPRIKAVLETLRAY